MRRSSWRQPGLGIIAPLLLALSLTSCGGDGGADGQDDKIKVITTLPLFADFVRQIGGDRVQVTSLVPTGADPHTWEPSPDDIKHITEADFAFANGRGLDASAVEVIEANLKQGGDLRPPSRLIELAELIPPAAIGLPESENPHIWLDIRGADAYAMLIRDVFNSLVGNAVSPFEENYSRYGPELAELDKYVRSRIGSIAENRRKLVTTHDAFAYFALAYGLDIAAVVAESPGQEPSPGDIAEIARVIEREGVTAVFVEPQIGEESRILEQAAEDAGVQVCTLYSDSLDDRVTNYIELIRFNADELARCLGDGS